MRAIDSTGVFR